MKRITATWLTVSIISFWCAAATSAKPNPDKDLQQATKVKSEISKLGTGPAAYIEVKLRDGRKLKGYVDQINENTFVVVDGKAGATEVPYPQVKHVKGNNLSTGAKVAIGVGIAVVVLMIVLKDHIMAY